MVDDKKQTNVTMRIESNSISRSHTDVYQILAPDGSVEPNREVPDLSDKTMIQMYTDMAFTRHFDERAVSLQRQGRLGTYPPGAGQEGAQVGSTYALAADDWVFPTYRENGVALSRGVAAEAVFRYWRGHESGNAELVAKNVFPYNIGIGSLIPHATGKAMAFDYRSDDDRAVLCHFGDGATSQGDFHEGLNFAGVFDVPAVFFCNNNQWAISMPSESQTASATIAQKAVAVGFDGVRVDGMDPLAVYEVTHRALSRARGDGESDSLRPTLIEAEMYRFGAHTTADDPLVYRDDEEVERWRQKDPISRFRRFLVETGRVDDERLDAIETKNEQRVADAIEATESYEGDPNEMFQHVFEMPTERLDRQRESLRVLRDAVSDDKILED
jgi:pyruvate dehydrogenase E1 component alpha subunit